MCMCLIPFFDGDPAVPAIHIIIIVIAIIIRGVAIAVIAVAIAGVAIPIASTKQRDEPQSDIDAAMVASVSVGVVNHGNHPTR